MADITNPSTTERMETTTQGSLQDVAVRDAHLTFLGHYEMAMVGTTVYHLTDVVGAPLDTTARTAVLTWRLGALGANPAGALVALFVPDGTTDPAIATPWGSEQYSGQVYSYTISDLSGPKFCNATATAGRVLLDLYA